MPNAAKIDISLPHRSYTVHIEAGALEALGGRVREGAPAGRCALIVDQAVLPLYADAARRSLEAAAYEVIVLPVPSGEATKSLADAARLYGALVAHRMERGAPVIALGGGVTGDLAGFVAATFLRGVPFVQVPTTLLAMVDASVGGKVGVNLPEGKNLVGAFHQPVAVIVDPDVLGTLPQRELRAGLAECIKHGAIRDVEILSLIERDPAAVLGLAPEVLHELLRRNIAVKAAVVMADERESGVRAHLNFGHTFAHAIETLRGYGTLLHGEAVGLGMLAAATLAERAGLCGSDVRARLERAVQAVKLPARTVLPSNAELLAAMRVDKKVAGARLRLVLVEQLGSARLYDAASDEAIAVAWDSIREAAA
jgi:3-dehydroquinate synthase